MATTTGMRRWRWLWIDDDNTSLPKLIRVLNERLKALADFLAGGGPGDGLYAAEGFLYNAGNVLVAGESDYLDIPSDFTITNAELVGDQAGTLSVSVYAASYGGWDPSGARWTLISGSAPLTLAGTDKSQSLMPGWTRTLTGGHYLKFVITGTPTNVTKATATLTLSVPLGAGHGGASPSGPAGGVLSGTYPSPTFAVDPFARANHTGTQLSSTISDFNSAARAQTEAELVAGSNVTITPGSSGATRTLTIAASVIGSTPAEVLITETVLGASASNVSFTPIAGSWRDLRIVVRGRGDKAASASCEVRMRFNNDTGANYDYQVALMNQANDADLEGRGTTYILLGYLTGATGPTSQPGTVNARIFDYRGTTFFKDVQSQNYGALVTSSGGFLYNNLSGGDWRSTSAITRVDVFPDSGNFITGTVVSLYGIL